MPRAPVGLQDRFYAPRGWTWSTLKVGSEAWRYGVASPPMVPKGSVLILSGGEEPAEVWFETTNDLIARGYTVWLLKVGTSGQGALDPDGLQTMIRSIIRPKRSDHFVIVGDGLGSTLALETLAGTAINGLRSAVLASPVLASPRIDLNTTTDQVQTASLWAHRLHPRLAPPAGRRIGPFQRSARSGRRSATGASCRHLAP